MSQLPSPSPHRSLILLIAACGTAAAQDLGTIDPKPLPPLEHPDDPKTPAKQLFGRKTDRQDGQPRSIGYYTHGCLAGGVALPINGPTWQVMRLSRNRNWGHPAMIKTLEHLSNKAPSIGWKGFLVGDMAQPRGGPMITGHWSHQVGLDADVWLTPMPDRELTRQEREEMSATNVVNDKWNDVDPDVWSDKYIALYKMLAQEPRRRARAGQSGDQEGAVPRRQRRPLLAAQDPPGGRPQLPFPYPHRLPGGQPECKAQPATPNDEGCGSDLDRGSSGRRRAEADAPARTDPDVGAAGGVQDVLERAVAR